MERIYIELTSELDIRAWEVVSATVEDEDVKEYEVWDMIMDELIDEHPWLEEDELLDRLGNDLGKYIEAEFDDLKA